MSVTDRKQERPNQTWTHEQQQEWALAQREAWQREPCWGRAILNLHQLEAIAHPRAFNMTGQIEFDRFRAKWSASEQEPAQAQVTPPEPDDL